MKRTSPTSTHDPKQARAQLREYLESLPRDVSRQLKKLHAAIRSAAPGAVESFTYGIPGFRLNGRPLVWCAGWKQHTSLYPLTAATRRAVAADLENYKTSKGTIRFPLTEPLPVTLVRKIVKVRVAEVRKSPAR